MRIDFKEKTALITGGTRGIGYAIANELLEAGATVYVTGTKDKNELSTQSGKDRLSKFNYIQSDFQKETDIEEFCNIIQHTLHPQVLINTAGINKIDLVENIDDQDWLKVNQVNLHAVFKIIRSALTNMKQNNYGRIVNISSIFSVVSKSGRASYSASKFALVGFTKALAADYAKYNILANCVAPGVIETDLTRKIVTEEVKKDFIARIPIGRFGTPDEVARLVLFLSSDLNTYITGQNMLIDGGFTSV